MFKNSERRNNFEVEKVGRNNSVNWNHTDLILNWNNKDSNSIRIDLNHKKCNQPIPANLINIKSIHDSDNMREIEKILVSPVYVVHTPPMVPASPIFKYGRASDPTIPSHDSSAEKRDT